MGFVYYYYGTTYIGAVWMHCANFRQLGEFYNFFKNNLSMAKIGHFLVRIAIFLRRLGYFVTYIEPLHNCMNFGQNWMIYNQIFLVTLLMGIFWVLNGSYEKKTCWIWSQSTLFYNMLYIHTCIHMYGFSRLRPGSFPSTSWCLTVILWRLCSSPNSRLSGLRSWWKKSFNKQIHLTVSMYVPTLHLIILGSTYVFRKWKYVSA
jgi:hypothetical protein